MIIRNEKFKSDISLKETQICYDYYFISLKNIINHKDNPLEYKWLHPTEISFSNNSIATNWNFEFDPAKDPFCADVNENKILLGLDVLKQGNYFPYVCHKNNDKYYVGEGRHRVVSLQMLDYLDMLPKDYKVLCFIYPESKILNSNLSIPLLYYNFSEATYGDYVRPNRKEYNLDLVYNDLNKNNGYFLNNNILVAKNSSNFDEIFYGIRKYPGNLRDNLYKYKDSIKPNLCINDKKEFEKWLKS
jgi:hypothetical protein